MFLCSERNQKVNTSCYLPLTKCLVLPATESCKQINTLRLQLFRIPAKIIRHSRSKIIQLSRFNVYDRLFWRVLERIEMI
ncbi:hypothetical protein FG051_05990 [Companilactobacillus futsaii]|uniref:Uncharacterized protein n=1 Tax=Companilactobacillus futsaii TaxID=938155 RepID=A0A5B7SYI1_9LACO|nr:hypothetical protein FG051_05990 [Companilactobacillus futsaii]